MESKASKRLFGIVTRSFDSPSENISAICVWNSNSPLKEYKFPRWSSVYPEWFPVGAMVEFEATRGIDQIQDESKIWKVKDPEKLRKITIITTPAADKDKEFKVKVHISFPPPGVENFRKNLEDAKPHGCYALAWCWEFGKVGLMIDGFEFEPGNMYAVYATRINYQKDWIANKMDTLWVICTDVPMSVVTDAALVEKLRQRIPWKNQLVMNLINGDGAPKNSGSQHSFNDDWSSNYGDSVSVNGQSSIPMLNRRRNSDELTITAEGLSMQLQSNLYNGQRTSSVGELSLSPSMMNSTGNIVERARRDHVQFGHLVASKLQSTYDVNPAAAFTLQKVILDICLESETELLIGRGDMNNNRGGRNNQQQSSSVAEQDLVHLF